MKNPPSHASTYVALLRGINVGGHKLIKMDQLRKAFEGLGFADVATYVQSGNVVFKAPQKASDDLSKKIEAMFASPVHHVGPRDCENGGRDRRSAKK